VSSYPVTERGSGAPHLQVKTKLFAELFFLFSFSVPLECFQGGAVVALITRKYGSRRITSCTYFRVSPKRLPALFPLRERCS
jgi:hypothetical protein